MTPERAEELYYTQYGSAMWQTVNPPQACHEVRMRCWQAVIDAVRRETDAEWSARLLETMT